MNMDHFKPHPDDEGVDRIELFVVPRYKTSGLSGDEWRTGVGIRLWRKGKVVHETSFSRMKYAVMGLGHVFMTMPENSNTALWGLNDQTCAQYGCAEPAVVVKQLKREYGHYGEGPLPEPNYERRLLRAFCEKHSTRGDCGLEDADVNYVPPTPPVPEESK